MSILPIFPCQESSFGLVKVNTNTKSLLFLFISGTVLIKQFKEQDYKDDFSITTKDEDAKLFQNPNYNNAVSAFNRKDYGIVIEELNEEVKNFNQTAINNFKLSLSAGVAHYDPANPTSLEELITSADAEMYKYKKGKKV